MLIVHEGNGRSFRVHTCHAGTTSDTTLHIFKGDFCTGDSRQGINNYFEKDSSCVGGNDDLGIYCAYNGYASSHEFCTEVNDYYYIGVGAYGDVKGEFELSVEEVGPCKGTFTSDDI